MAAPREKKTTSPQLTIKLLGRFEVLRDGKPISEEAWGRRKTKTLLKVLLTEPGRVFTQDQLIEALFEGENPRNAVKNLYGRVSQLRRGLEPELKRGSESRFIVRRGQGYCFNADGPCWIDTSEFLKHFARGEEQHQLGQHAKAIDAYEDAIRLYCGELLETDRYEEWVLKPREECRERYITALSQQAEDYAHLGDCHQAALACHEAFNLQPWRESVLQQLMRHHQEAGERSEALQAYQTGVKALKEELDVEPSAETEALHREILRSIGPAQQATYDKKRIVVLPIHNISPDPEDEYFADGMTEELIHKLSGIDDLKVIAQTSALSYKNTRKTIAQIGRELSIGTALEGSVRKAGNVVRIIVQLIDVESEEHIWSKEYERPLKDVFAIQSDVASQVAGALRLNVTDSQTRRMTEEPTANLGAYALYLKGRCFQAKKKEPSLEKAGEYFKQAIGLDPGFAPAHSALALNYFMLVDYSFLTPRVGYPQARAAAERALEIDASCPEALMILATLHFVQDRDLPAAEEALNRLIACYPSFAEGHRMHAIALMYLSRWDESDQEIRTVLQLDPLSVLARRNLATILFFKRSYDEAIQVVRDALELEPEASRVHTTIGNCYYMKGMYEEALAEYDRETVAVPRHLVGAVYAAMGRKDEALQILDDLIEESANAYVRTPDIASLCFALGEDDEGFRFLEEAHQAGEVLMILKESPSWDSVRSDPRFVSFLQRLGLAGQ